LAALINVELSLLVSIVVLGLVCIPLLVSYVDVTHVLQDIEQWVQNVLPSRGFGHLVLTTTFGIMDHDEARAKKTGGKILGFFY
jgi:nitrate reductase gamma subunit